MKIKRPMPVVTIDAETHYSATYSLSKMAPLEYVMDDQFQFISMSIKVDNYPTDVFFGERDIIGAFDAIKDLIPQSLLIAHNMSGFDAYVLAYRLGLRPRLWGCTLAMARPLHAKTCGVSLGKLVEHYNIGKKDQTALINTRGKRLEDFTPAEIEAMRAYNRDDADQCKRLFDTLKPHYTAAEMWQIDALIRMRTEPAFELCVPLLEKTAREEAARKRDALLELSVKLDLDTFASDDETLENVRAELASAPRFAALLESLGVDVPTKASPTNPDKRIPALAKTDEAFLALQEHDNELVAAAASARLDVKSTLLETRIQSWMRYGRAAGGMMPVPLNYCGADTTGRDSGADGLNMQNQPRVNPKAPKPTDALRMSLRAPKGKLVIVADQSGIELRVNHFLWQVASSMALYQASPDEADLYKEFASDLFGKPVEEIDKDERQVGKVAQLGLGFGSAAETFQRIARVMGGIDMPVHAVGDELDAFTVVQQWRTKYAEIVNGWKRCNTAIQHIARGEEVAVDPWGLVHTCHEGFVLPSGRLIRYPDLHQEDDGNWPDGRPKKSWFYGLGRHKARIQGAKATENCLAGNALVLTDSGWKNLADILHTDLVHDGVEFVRHDGLLAKGEQVCISVDGVLMTPDHEVLTDEGWQAAGTGPRPYRPNLRLLDGNEVRRHQRTPRAVGLPLSLRRDGNKVRHERDERSTTWGNTELRVFDGRFDGGQATDTRDVKTPSVRSVAFDVGSLPSTIPPSVGKLRRAWHHGLRAVAGVVREFLAGHGSLVFDGAGLGSAGQRLGLYPRELPLGSSANQHHEQAQHRANSGRAGTQRSDGDRANNPIQPDQERVAPRQADAPAGRAEQVFDILNCGPRHRFVVLGDAGPFIVHNCVQALARDSIFDCSLEYFKRTGLRPAMRIHDELVYVVDEAPAEELLNELQAVLRTPPKWWPDLIVWSEGGVAPTYGEVK